MAWFSYTDNLWGLLLFWSLTGFGGGTVFCIKHLSDNYERISMELSENIGHVLGPLAGFILCILFPGREVFILTLAACGFVLLALVTALIITLKE